MKTLLKIVLWISGIAVALILGAAIYLNYHLNHIITHAINHSMDSNDTISLHVDDVAIHLISGDLCITGVDLQVGHDSINGKVHPHTNIHVDQVRLEHINYRSVIKEKRLIVEAIIVKSPFIYAFINEKPAPHNIREWETLHELRSQERKARQDSVVAMVSQFLTEVRIEQLIVEDAMAEIRSVSTGLNVQMERLSSHLHQLGYSLVDTIPYSLSHDRYSFSLERLHFITPDKLTAIEVNSLHTQNGEGLCFGPMHIRNTVDKWNLTNYREQGPVSWIDLQVKELKTSDLNMIDKAFDYSNGFQLDEIDVVISNMHIFSDLREKAIHPLPMPQEGLLGLKYPFQIKRLNAEAEKVHCEIAMTDHNCGSIFIHNMQANVNNITAHRGAAITAKIQGQMGDGAIHANASFKVNQACNWDIQVEGQEMALSAMNDFLYPVMGMQAGGTVHQLTANYGGDRFKADGTFCMLYDGLKLLVSNDVQPAFVVIRDLSELINSFVETCVPKSNPRREGKQPNRYNVHWEHDVMHPSALFIMGPAIDGMIKTFLPGLYLSSRIKDKTNERKNK